MASRVSSQRRTPTFNMRVTLWLYPRLRELPAEAWADVLAKARGAQFDMVEWLSIVGSMGLVAWLLDKPAFAVEPRLVSHIVQFALALTLLVAVVGPLYWRRTRRGLERELASRAAATQVATATLEGKES